MTLTESIDRVIERKPVLVQEQTAKERLIFALLHPGSGLGHRIGSGHVGEHVGDHVGDAASGAPSIGTHGIHHPERGFIERTFEHPEHVREYHVGFDTAQKTHGHETDKKRLKVLKSEHNKALFRIDQQKEPLEAARYRGFIDGLHKIAGSTPADLGEVAPPKVEPKPVDHIPAHLGGQWITSTGDHAEHLQQAQRTLNMSVPELYHNAATDTYILDKLRDQAGNSFDPNKLEHARVRQRLDLVMAELKHRRLPLDPAKHYENEQAFQEARKNVLSDLFFRALSVEALKARRIETEGDFRSTIDPGRQALAAGRLDGIIELQQRHRTMPEPDFRYDDQAQQDSFDDAYRATYMENYGRKRAPLQFQLGAGAFPTTDPISEEGRRAAIQFLIDHQTSAFETNEFRAAYPGYLSSWEKAPTKHLAPRGEYLLDKAVKAGGLEALQPHDQAEYLAIKEATKRRSLDPLVIPDYSKYDHAPNLMPEARENYERAYRSAWVDHRRDLPMGVQSAYEQAIAGKSASGNAVPGREGQIDSLQRLRGLRGLSDEPAPHYSDDPALQKSFERGYRIGSIKHKDLSQVELDREAERYFIPKSAGFNSPEKEAENAGQRASIEKYRPDAPQFPAEPTPLPEHQPGGEFHDAFERERLDQIGRLHRKLASNGEERNKTLLRERKDAQGELARGEAANHSGVILNKRARIAAIDHIFRNPWVARSFAPDPVKKLKPAEVTDRFGANRWEQVSPIHDNEKIYDKHYKNTLSHARKEIGGRTLLERGRSKAEISLAFSQDRQDQLEAHAELAAIDKRLSEIPSFGPETKPYKHEVRRDHIARSQAEYAHAESSKALRAAVDEAAAAAPVLINGKRIPYIYEAELTGTSPEMERLSEDLHLLGHYIEIPVGTKNGRGFLGEYTPFQKITTNSIDKPERPVLDAEGNFKRDKYGNIQHAPTPQINQHAKVLAHEFGHHYAFMTGGKMENFSNSTYPDRPNRDEIIAESVAQNITRHYGLPSDKRSNAYVFRMTGNDPTLALYNEPEVQETIKNVTARIIADIARAREGVTHIQKGDEVTPITDDRALSVAWLPSRKRAVFAPGWTTETLSDSTVDHALTNGLITGVRRTDGDMTGINASYHGELQHGGETTRVLIKPTENFLFGIKQNNLAAVVINRAMGNLMSTPDLVARPVSIEGHDRESIVQPYVEHAIPAKLFNENQVMELEDRFDPVKMAAYTERQETLKLASPDIALFDVVTANMDRTPRNWMIVSPPGEGSYAMGIDHDMILANEGSRDMAVWGPASKHMDEPLTERQIGGLERIKARQTHLEAELRALSIDQDEIDRMFARIDWLLAHKRFPNHRDPHPPVADLTPRYSVVPGWTNHPGTETRDFLNLLDPLMPKDRAPESSKWFDENGNTIIHSAVLQEQSPHDRAMFAHLHPALGIGHPIGTPIHEIRARFRDILYDGEIGDVRPLTGAEAGANNTFIGTLTHESHALRVFIKPSRNRLSRTIPIARNNLLAGEVNAAMGNIMATPETVQRSIAVPNGPLPSTSVERQSLVSPWQPHAEPGRKAERTDRDVHRFTSDIALFDIVTSNGDRNPGNWLMIDPPGESSYAMGIDHDLLFIERSLNPGTGVVAHHAGYPLTARHLNALHQLMENRSHLEMTLRAAGLERQKILRLFDNAHWLMVNRHFPLETDFVSSVTQNAPPIKRCDLKERVVQSRVRATAATIGT